MDYRLRHHGGRLFAGGWGRGWVPASARTTEGVNSCLRIQGRWDLCGNDGGDGWFGNPGPFGMDCAKASNVLVESIFSSNDL